MQLLEVRSGDGTKSVKFTWCMDEWGSIFSHRIIVKTSDLFKEFDLGGCAGFGFRRVQAFFGNVAVEQCSLGFRNPHIITYDLTRSVQSGISLAVDDTAQEESFVISLDESPEATACSG
ncbi:MAG: hypothetical protein JWM59_3388 [Verrucomicrobiales bacterium]|nr:hypothetical protein [Verrucomicrobiales bacterium]